MFQDDLPPVIPAWINGRAVLSLAPEFTAVCHAVSGKVLRRTPLCSADMAKEAIAAARVALASWAALPEEARVSLLVAVADELSGYAAHFAGLIADESGQALTQAAAEVSDSVALLRSGHSANVSGVVAISGNALRPLHAALQRAIPALVAGAVVVIRPSPETPSALLAFAELTGRCDLPPGVLNVVHGSDAVDESLRGVADISLLSELPGPCGGGLA